ncbi:hypothetical protein CCACVL1_08611 [Corchorus capsularis]|uniref:Uncharacterized protein n=1 Tax=Corchorus capsularis TaxID=210143 RepID=A0A1R3IZK2_COCAP|nr:hypothetical protein CCACVL1_08611 [Corchorus capsularis]
MANNHLKGEISVEYCELDHLRILDLSAEPGLARTQGHGHGWD